MSSGSKRELGERLRRATGLPLRCVTAFLRISKSSYEYHGARLGRDKYAWLRPWVRELFAWMGGGRGYRAVWAELRRRGVARAPQPAAAAGRAAPVPRRAPQRAVGDRHHRVQAAVRREALPQPGDRLSRRQAGLVVGGPQAHGGARARRGARGPLRQGLPLPVARLDGAVPRARFRPQHVAQGHER